MVELKGLCRNTEALSFLLKILGDYMDELKLKLQTKLMRGIVAKLLMKAIYAKLGYKVGELIK